jgi:hypothetical protein
VGIRRHLAIYGLHLYSFDIRWDVFNLRLFPHIIRLSSPQHTTIMAGQQVKAGMPPLPAADRARPLSLGSTFDGPAARVSDPDPIDLDRRAVRFQRFRHHRCKAGDHKSCQHVARELVGKYKQLRGDATRTAGE